VARGCADSIRFGEQEKCRLDRPKIPPRACLEPPALRNSGYPSDPTFICRAGRAERSGSERQAFLNLQPHQVEIPVNFEPRSRPISNHLEPRTSHRIATRASARRRRCVLQPRHPDAPHLLHSRSRKPSASRRKRYVTSIKRSTHSNSSCPTPHLQVSLRNPHPHHIHLYPPDRRLQRQLSSPHTMQAMVHPPPRLAPSPASRPDK